MSPSSSKHFFLLTASVFVLGFCESRAASADNGLVSVSSDSPSIRGILAVGDDFAVFRDTASAQAPASLTVIGIGDMKVETPKVVPLSGKSSVRYRAKDSRTWEDPATGTVYPIRIDIEQDTVYVPYGDSATTLNLTDDSTWGIWDVIWSSEPAGISGRGSSINIPDNLRQGHYTVTAAFSENPDWNDTCNVEVIRIEVSPKNLQGCVRCLEDVSITTQNCYSPGGIEWVVLPSDDISGPSITEEGCLSLDDSIGGYYFVRAISKDLSQCQDSLSLTIFSVSDMDVNIVERLEAIGERPSVELDNGYLDGLIESGGVLVSASQRFVDVVIRFEPPIMESREHFQVVQFVKGEARHADGSALTGVHQYGSDGCDWVFPDWRIDSYDSDPAAVIVSYDDANTWIYSDCPVVSPFRDGTKASLTFRTATFCATTVPKTCNATTTIDSVPIKSVFWRFSATGKAQETGQIEILH